ncbi:electron transport complex subunit RsxC [Jeotgalibaca caeni]|uniref:electron transport complex subunit RsxC n=1 Tax=Jeotgalibaca caeni TaxID=3028623 RepID=UPI00237DE135|nr:electron transport complex subunit RsxC [Jeotgalibaca caeni]MDE1548081.1 electron transport complex subunit RsxC [Jeotgalibaca caeni]
MQLKFRFKKNRKGSFPEERKDRTEHLPIETAKVPDVLIFPLGMHIGAPAEAVVDVGDQVKMGTLIGKGKDGISANIISSVSGEVIAISERDTMNGPGTCIVIRNDHKDTKEVPLYEKKETLSADEKLEIIRKAGIVGMGGATFPTAVKASPNPKKPIDTIILNGAECELYSTSDHRLMIEHAEEIIKGARVVQEILKAKRIYIALEDDTPDCEAALEAAIEDHSDIEMIVLPTMYPQGAEKVLIEKITGREVPAGGLPADVRVFLMNVGTSHAIHEAVNHGLPLVERVTTVSGDPVAKAKNLRVRIGTPINALIEECEGFVSPPGKLLHGGPMMGKPLASAEVPVTKGTAAITFLHPEETEREEQTDCIRCSECINVCPVNLQPILISNAYERGDIEESERLGAMDCIECGNCSFICPSKIPLLDNIRGAKAAIKAKNAG